MSGDPRIVELATFVRAHVHEIVADWAPRARALTRARELDQAELIDHVPPLLERIADIAEGVAAGQEVPQPRDLAEKHAATRLEQGFQIAEVVQEYTLIRESILASIARAGAPFSVEHARVLDSALDSAVAGSVAAYVAARDRILWSLDRIGTAALESHSLDDLLRRVLEVFVSTTPAADAAAIFIVDGNELRLRAAVGLGDELESGFSLPIRGGFAGTVAASRAPLSSEDAARLARSALLRVRGVKALFGLPLVEEGGLLGVAHVGSLTRSAFSHADQQLFAAMAARAAAAIYRAMLRESAEQRARQQRAVADFGSRALRASSLGEVLEDAVVTTAATLGTELAEILELEPQGRTLVVRAGTGFRPGVVGATRVDAHPGSQAGYTLASASAVIVDDLRAEPRFTGAPVHFEHGVISGVTVVIGARGPGGRPFGVLGAYTTRRRSFTTDDVAFLEAMANVVASAITRAQYEARARETEERFRLIVEQVRDYSIIVLDPAGRVETWTLGAQRMTQWQESEVLGRHFASFYPADDVRAGRPERAIARARAEGHFEDEGWRVRKDGTRFWANVTLTCLTDDAGKLRGYAAVTRDLTERRRAESRHHFLADASRRLAESLEMEPTLRSIAQLCIERLSDLCAIDLLEDDETLRRVTLEHRDAARKELVRELEERYPTPPERSVPHTVARTGEPVLMPDITDALLRSVARDEKHLELLRALGLRSYVCVPMRVAGRVLGTITLGSDDPRRLHDQIDLEVAEELAQRAALAIENARLYDSAQQAIERREEVLAVVSHDLRNPLNVVQMGATLLVEGGGESLGSVEEQATRILRAAKRMNRLIQDLLDLASLEKGRLALIRRVEDPSSIAREATETFRAPAREGELTIGLDVRGSPPPIVADRDRILQVLANLCSNAVRITPPGGELVVGVEPQGDGVVFRVRDTGPGIAPDELPHLFERYWRGRDVAYRGTGRGLAIAKGIADAHGGRIWVESQLGQGTTFYVWLPAAQST